MTKEELCKNCILHEDAITNCMDGRGSTTPRIIFIGEAPGKDEDEKGQPFVGKAGRQLREFITKYKIHSKDYFITNTVRCRPPKNRNPSRAEIRACSSYLFGEIQRLKPEILVPLGNIALRAVLGVTGIHSYRNRIVRSDTYNCDVLPMLHPSAINRNPAHKELMDKDFQKLKEYLASNTTVVREETLTFGDIHLVNTSKQLSALFKKVLKRGIMFWDVETNGEDLYNTDDLELTSVSVVCEPRVGHVFPLTEYDEEMNELFIEKFMRPLLENSRI